jgi:hypothetical protein
MVNTDPKLNIIAEQEEVKSTPVTISPLYRNSYKYMMWVNIYET